MNNFGKNLALWIVIGLLLVALFNLFQTSSNRGPQSTLAFSDFATDVDRGQVTDVTIQGNNITGHFTDGRAFTTYAPNDPGLVNRLMDKGVRITAAPVGDSASQRPMPSPATRGRTEFCFSSSRSTAIRRRLRGCSRGTERICSAFAAA